MLLQELPFMAPEDSIADPDNSVKLSAFSEDREV
jgi:hypothetical protein